MTTFPTSGIRVAGSQTMFSYQKTLVLSRIQSDKSGRYICSATNMDGAKNTTDRLVIVKGALKRRPLPFKQYHYHSNITMATVSASSKNVTSSCFYGD